MRAMITMSDYEIWRAGFFARGAWERRKERLAIATGAAHVTSGILHEWRDPATRRRCASVSFRSSAWTGR